MGQKNSEQFIRTCLLLILSLLVIAIILPMGWIVLSSLKNNNEFFSTPLKLPGRLLYVNYQNAWNLGLSRYFINSVLVSGVSIALTIVFGSACAYGLTRFYFKGQTVLFYLILGGLLLSPQVAVLPLYRMLNQFGIYNTYWAMILPYVAFRLPFAIFLIRSYFLSFPRELEESAYIDGCNALTTFTRIVLPISKPILASTAIVTGIFVWNEFLFALIFIENKSLMTIPIGLSTFRDALTTDYTTMLAGIVIGSLPIMILYLAMQRSFIKGLTAGSVKG